LSELGIPFDYAKPIGMLQHLIEIVRLDKNDIIIDFFAGASSTAHAVIKRNALTGDNHKFVMVQIPEATDENSEARSEGYETIAEISKKRIHRAGKKILEGQHHEGWNKDIGFRVLKIDTSNMKDVYYTPEKTQQTLLLDAVNNIKLDRTHEDLLFQALLDWGIDLTLPISQKTMLGKTVFFVDETALVACFDADITEQLIKELALAKPLRVVFRDNGFTSDAVKINAEQIFKQLSPTTDLRSI
jgi:adenine-specific DNA-methyltransferase